MYVSIFKHLFFPSGVYFKQRKLTLDMQKVFRKYIGMYRKLENPSILGYHSKCKYNTATRHSSFIYLVSVSKRTVYWTLHLVYWRG